MVPSQHYCTTCGAANQPQGRFCFACGKPLQTSAPSSQYPAGGSAGSTSTGLLTSDHLLKQRYRIIDQLGRGGFGAVYKAEDTQLGNRLLAVKEMSQSGLSQQEIVEATENFKCEALMLAALKHPHLPSIYDYFSEAGRWYLVMDFIEGETLEERLNKEPEGHLPVEETLQIGIQLCTVLSYLHSRQPPIIFRDLKLANIMLTSDNHLYLIDFGIARHFKPGQAKDTIAFGSPGYAAPEQYGKAQTTARSDIYSMGATLHQLFTGVDPSQTPFHFVPIQLQGRPTPIELQQLIMQMLELDASKRPESMSAIKEELQRIITQQTANQLNTVRPNTSSPPVVLPASPAPSTHTIVPDPSQHAGTFKIAAGHFLKAKRYAEALAAFERAIQLDAKDATVHNGKGLALTELKRHAEALAAFERAVQLDPNFANACINLGLTLYNLNRYGEALTACDRAIRLESSNATFYNLKGLALAGLGRNQEALAAYEQTVQLNPNLAIAYSNKGLALSNLKRYEEALAACEQALRLNPNLTIAYNNKGGVLLALMRYEEALAAFERAVQLDPHFFKAYGNKVSTYYHLKRYKEALSTCEQAIQLEPKNALMHNFKGNILLALHHYGEALAAYEQAIRLDPKFATAYSNRGNVLCILRRYREALAACERAIRLDLNLAVAYSNKSIALCGLKRFGEAIGACEQAIQLDPNLAVAYNNKGLALQGLGRSKEALQAFNKARQLGYGR